MKIGRPLEFDPDTVVDAAMALFWEQGYEATSLQDLLEHMHLSKSSLYQTFGSKHALFLRCIDRYHERTMVDLQARLDGRSDGFQFIAETLNRVIQEVNELANPKGCLVTNTANEFAQSDREIARRVAAGLAGYRDIFRQAVVKGQREGSIRSDITPDQLANYLVTGMSGLRTMVKAGTDGADLRQAVDVIVTTLH